MTWSTRPPVTASPPWVETAPNQPVAGPYWPSGLSWGSLPLISGPELLTLAEKTFLGLTPPAIAWYPLGQSTWPVVNEFLSIEGLTVLLITIVRPSALV